MLHQANWVISKNQSGYTLPYWNGYIHGQISELVVASPKKLLNYWSADQWPSTTYTNQIWNFGTEHVSFFKWPVWSVIAILLQAHLKCRNYVTVDVFEFSSSLVASFPHYYFVAVVFKRSSIPPLPPLPLFPYTYIYIYIWPEFTEARIEGSWLGCSRTLIAIFYMV